MTILIDLHIVLVQRSVIQRCLMFTCTLSFIEILSSSFVVQLTVVYMCSEKPMCKCFTPSLSCPSIAFETVLDSVCLLTMRCGCQSNLMENVLPYRPKFMISQCDVVGQTPVWLNRVKQQ